MVDVAGANDKVKYLEGRQRITHFVRHHGGQASKLRQRRFVTELFLRKLALRDVAADGKVILLDEDGNLGLVTMTAEGLKILAKAPVATATSWTVPTLIGTTLYLRDRVNVVALAVGAN